MSVLMYSPFLVTAPGFNEVPRPLLKLGVVKSSDASLSVSRLDLEVEENFPHTAPPPPHQPSLS